MSISIKWEHFSVNSVPWTSHLVMIEWEIDQMISPHPSTNAIRRKGVPPINVGVKTCSQNNLHSIVSASSFFTLLMTHFYHLKHRRMQQQISLNLEECCSENYNYIYVHCWLNWSLEFNIDLFITLKINIDLSSTFQRSFGKIGQ